MNDVDVILKLTRSVKKEAKETSSCYYLDFSQDKTELKKVAHPQDHDWSRLH